LLRLNVTAQLHINSDSVFVMQFISPACRFCALFAVRWIPSSENLVRQRFSRGKTAEKCQSNSNDLWKAVQIRANHGMFEACYGT